MADDLKDTLTDEQEALRRADEAAGLPTSEPKAPAAEESKKKSPAKKS